MDSMHGKVTITKVEGDRLNNLPDELIHIVLSLMGIKQAIQTSVLSSRWRHLWTSMPCLSFSSVAFDTCSAFGQSTYSDFVTRVLSGRNNQSQVSSIMLTFYGEFSRATSLRILNYGFTHNIQQLDITYLTRTTSDSPLSLLCSESLKHLTLNGYNGYPYINTQPTWKLPALTTLNLCFVILNDDTDKCDGLFANYAKLKHLTLKECTLVGSNGFNIHHPGLISLTLKGGSVCDGVNVVTPQLKNLSVTNCRWLRLHLISAPNLTYLHYRENFRHFANYHPYFEDPLKLSTELLHLEKVDICIDRPFIHRKFPSNIVGLLQQLNNVKFLTLNLELVKLLSSSVELILHQPSPFVNLKSLKIYRPVVTEPELHLSAEVKNYLLDGSPGATFTMVSHEDVRAIKNTKLAENLITKLQGLLVQEKARTDTKMAKMVKLQVAQVDNHIYRYNDRRWDCLSLQVEKDRERASDIISKLKEIKDLIRELPASHMAIIQPFFSALCVEANIVMNKITDLMKMNCDQYCDGYQRRLSVCFHELATTLEPSS